jgi:hypothetical protein
MNARLDTLRKRLSDAKADADASKREVRQASAAKLAKLRALPDPAARLAGLNDPALLPYDRRLLEQAIADLLPQQRTRLPRTVADTMRGSFLHARYHWRGLALLILVAIPLVVIGSYAVRHTGHAKIYLDSEIDITWTFADGHTEVRRQPTKIALHMMGREPNGDVRLRSWSATEGYGESIMSAETYGRFVTSTAE